MTQQSAGPTNVRRLLSIDGGGLAGLIPAECLVRMEEQLNGITNTQLPLGRRFDLIGGTSTGSILAAGLCLGLKASELRDFYLQYGKEIFTKSFVLERFWHNYSADPLIKRLKEKFAEATTLGSAQLLTNLMVVTKNATQGTTWFFTNNPRGTFFAANKDLPLWQVVRASTAAPTYFPPQKITVPTGAGGAQEYEFIDGGVSTFNNPSLQLFLEATEPTYNFGWPAGADKLLLLSCGTGYNPVTVPEGKASGYNLLDWARYSVKALLEDANLQQNVLMHLIGQVPAPVAGSAASTADSMGVAAGGPSADVIDNLAVRLGAAKLLTYRRFTVKLTRERLDALDLKDIDPIKVREMDAVDQIPNMQRIGQKIAIGQVHMEQFRNFFV